MINNGIINLKIKVENKIIYILEQLNHINGGYVELDNDELLLKHFEIYSHFIPNVIFYIGNKKIISNCSVVYDKFIVLTLFAFNDNYISNEEYEFTFKFNIKTKKFIIDNKTKYNRLMAEYNDFFSNNLIFMYKIKKGIAICKKYIHYKFYYILKDIYDKARYVNVFFKNSNNYVIITIKDITKQEKLLNKITQQEKISLLSTLCDGFAHDFNNQLMILQGNIDLLDHMSEELYSNYILNIKNASNQLSYYIKQLILFSKNNLTVLHRLKIDDLIDSCINNIKYDYDKCVIFYDKQISDEFIYGNKSLIEASVYNILSNSYESFTTSSNNLICVVVSKVYLNKKPVDSVFKTFKKGFYIKISFLDNSIGISEVNVKKVFDPFFTFGKDGHSGLGLTLTLGSILQHNAIISINSKENIGTNICMYFKTEEKVEQLQLDFNSEDTLKTIVVVDDEELICMILSQIITNLGYNVVTFINPYAAIDYYKYNNKDILLVISDMMMPLLNGYDLFYNLKGINNKLKFILLTAYSNKELDEDFLNSIDGFLTKPISMQDINLEIKRIIM